MTSISNSFFFFFRIVKSFEFLISRWLYFNQEFFFILFLFLFFIFILNALFFFNLFKDLIFLKKSILNQARKIVIIRKIFFFIGISSTRQILIYLLYELLSKVLLLCKPYFFLSCQGCSATGIII